jgi:hypothetical protein
VITEVAWDGSIRCRALDTASLTDPDRWESLIEQVLAIPPPYRATSGAPVYVLHASRRAVVMSEENLIGSLQQLGDRHPDSRRPMFTAVPARRRRRLRHRPNDLACDLDGGPKDGKAFLRLWGRALP